MSLSGALIKLDQATNRAKAVAAQFENGLNLSKAEWNRIGNIAAQGLRSIIIKMLVINYKESGLVKRTGKLENAIKNSSVIFYWQGNNPVLKISMPAGVSDYQRKNKDGSVSTANAFEVFGSLNYGAVRMQKRERDVVDTSTGNVERRRMTTIGAKAKRSIKKKLLGQKQSARSKKAIAEGRKLKSGFIMTQGVNVGAKSSETDRTIKTSGGSENITVIKPYNFYKLTPSQSKYIGDTFSEDILTLAYKKAGIR